MTRLPSSTNDRTAASPAFKDGLGTRERAADQGGDAVEHLLLASEVAGQESAIRDRVGRLINFRHARYVRLRGVDRAKTGTRSLYVAYDALEGHRLSTVLEAMPKMALSIEVDVALQIVRDLLPAIGILHDSRKVTHGCIAPERLVYTSQQRLVIVDHGLGAALQRMNVPRAKLWSQYRIASPAPTRALFDEKMDVVQIGLVALGLLLGRALSEDEYPGQIKRLIFGIKEQSSRIGSRPIGPELRRWLERATGVDEAQTFSSIKEAQDAFEGVLAVDRYAPTAAAVKAFFLRYDELAPKAAPKDDDEKVAGRGTTTSVNLDSALAGLDMQVRITPTRRRAADTLPEAVEIKPTPKAKTKPAEQTPAAPAEAADAVATPEVKFGRRKSDRLDALQALQDEMNLAGGSGDVSALEQTANAVYQDAAKVSRVVDDGERVAREAAERARQEAEAREQAEREGRALAEQVARDAAEQVVREAADRAAAERQARAASEREALERGARQEAERQAHEASLRATREATDREAAEKAAREASERAESERGKRKRLEREHQEAAELRAKEQAEREAAEREAHARREERERERDARVAAEREVAEKAQRELAEARQHAEREVQRAAERAAKEAADRAAAEKAAREAAARAEKEAVERAAAEQAAREAKERAERAERAAVERAERAEREAAERADRAAREAQEKAERAAKEAAEQAAREAGERADRAERAAREAAEQAARQAAERAERAERAAQEAAEKAAREAAERAERAERAAQEAAEKAHREANAREAVERQAREQAEREAQKAAERAAKEAAERAAAEQAARQAAERAERAEREAAERAQRAAREAAERAQQEAAEREAAHRIARELAEQAVLEAAEREAGHRAALEAAEQAVREAAERAATERAAREAAEQAAREASERALADLAQQGDAATRAAVAHAERNARALAERETREMTERAQREAAERAAAERSAREHAARAEAEREARAAAEREAKKAADRAAREAAERHAAEKAAREAAALMEAERQARAAAEARANEAAEQAAREVAGREAAERAAREAQANEGTGRRRRKKRIGQRTQEEVEAVTPLPSVTDAGDVPAHAPLAATADAPPMVSWQPGQSVEVLPAWARGANTMPTEPGAAETPEPEVSSYTPSASEPYGTAYQPPPTQAIEPAAASASILPFKPQAPDTWMHRAPQGVEMVPAEAEPRAVAQGPTQAPRRYRINWARTLAASLLVALLEGVAFATAWWYVTPEQQGWLVVHTKPAGIQVSIDGGLVGQTPFAKALVPGRHTIELRYGTATRVVPVEISPGVQTEQRISWGNGFNTGQASITSTNPGSKVLIDGRQMGKTPLTVSDLLPGKHEVTVEGESGSVSTMLIVEAGETTELDVPVYAGWVSVLSPVQLEILLDGKLIGSTEIEKLMLKAGKHTLQLENETLGYKSTVDVRVRPGATTSVSVVPKAPVTVEAPEGTELSINGENMGTLPNPALEVPLGTAEFVMRYKDEERRVVVPATMLTPVIVKYDAATPVERERPRGQ